MNTRVDVVRNRISDGIVNKLSNFDLDMQILTTLSIRYSLDLGFVLSVWALETGWGKSFLWIEHNNPAGIKQSENEYKHFPTKEEGIKEMFILLNDYCKSGLVTVEQIRNIWSETDDSDEIVSIWKMLEEVN